MPQAPLPAPANRITVPELFHGYVQQIGQPFNVMPYMRYPDMIESATKGLKLGSMMARLPAEGRENAYQYAMAGMAKEHANQLQDALKEVDQLKVDARTKSWLKEQILGYGGVGFNAQGQGTISPFAGMQQGLSIQQQLNNLLLQRQGNPGVSLPTGPTIQNPPGSLPSAPRAIPVKPAAPSGSPQEQNKAKRFEDEVGFIEQPQQAQQFAMTPAPISPGVAQPQPAAFLQNTQFPGEQLQQPQQFALMPAPVGATVSDYYV